MKKRRTYTAEFKAKVVIEILTGLKSPAEICREHKIYLQVLNRWKSQFLEQAPVIFEKRGEKNAEQQRIADLEQMVGRLTMEVELLKKASNLLTSPAMRGGRS